MCWLDRLGTVQWWPLSSMDCLADDQYESGHNGVSSLLGTADAVTIDSSKNICLEVKSNLLPLSSQCSIWVVADEDAEVQDQSPRAGTQPPLLAPQPPILEHAFS